MSDSIYPRIGDQITPIRGAFLCQNLGMNRLATRVINNLDNYKSFCFDGISGIDTLWFIKTFNYDYHKLVNQCILIHDLRYAYGRIGDSVERKTADLQLYHNLRIKAGMNFIFALIFYFAIRLFGYESGNHNYSWGFANKDKKVIKEFPCNPNQ